MGMVELRVLTRSINEESKSKPRPNQGSQSQIGSMAISPIHYLASIPESQPSSSPRNFIQFVLTAQSLKYLELLDMRDSTLNSSNSFQTIGTMTSLKTLMLQRCSLNGQLPTSQVALLSKQHLPNHQNDDLSQNFNVGGLQFKWPITYNPRLCDLNHLQELDISSMISVDSCLVSGKSDIPSTTRSLLQSLENPYFVEPIIQPFKTQEHFLNSFTISSTYPNKGRVPKLVDREQHIPTRSLFRKLPRSSHVNLSFLSISMNYFQGQIPAEIRAYLPGLQVLLMFDNGFNGSIPSSLGSMSSLRLLDLSNNFLTERILSNNSLQGQIPGWIWNMSSLEFLYLLGNNLSGPLPSRFSASSKLRYVHLSRNKLQDDRTKFYDS
uniref:Leucine-rich repeat-containing N-terminal plant-type domain-containing protein n=1 Tax=Salix viminalis TaxID=40686 RepID=A0A6N2KPW8_SALVM